MTFLEKLARTRRGGRRWLSAVVPIRSTLLWAGLVVMVVGARLILVADYGSSLPMYDQWDGEGSALFKPWLDGHLRFPDFFIPHNEHRMVPSKLLMLGLLRLNGQWDGRLEMTVNAILCGFIALFLAVAVMQLFERPGRIAVLAVIACWSCLPYAWENTTWGFQSSFYLLIFFSLLAIWGLGLNEVFSVAWWVGLAAALIAGVTMGSGVLAMGPVIGLEAVRAIKSRSFPLRGMASVIAACAVVALFVYFRVHHPDEPFKATSLRVWWISFSRSISWPFANTYAWTLIYCPLALFLVAYFRPGKKITPEAAKAAEAFLAVNGWVLLQAGALAYARALQNLETIPSRYRDMLALGAAANCFLVLWWVRRNALRRPLDWVAAASGMIWVAAVLAGTISLSRGALFPAAEKGRVARQAEQSVRAYIATDDRSVLHTFPPWHLPYPWLEPLKEKLDDPAIRGILPAVVATPLALTQESGSAVFRRDRTLSGLGWAGDPAWASDPDDKVGGTMRSAVIHPRLPYLRFDVWGSFGPKMSIHVRDETTGRERQWQREGWVDGRAVGHIAASPGGVRVIARDEESEGAFAFADPRETGRLSYYTEVLLRRSRTILRWGAGLILAGLLLSAFSREERVTAS